MRRLETHEIATLFPSMSDVDLEHLRESIAKQGQLEPILTFEGKVLDGRHRYDACLALGLEPRLREFTGTAQEAFAHSVALNLSRRHLTTVQRAAAGAGMKEFQARLLAQAQPAAAADETPVAAEPSASEPAPEVEIDVSIDETRAEAAPSPAKSGPSARTINARARELASARVGVSGRAIDTAAKIKQDAPDVFERMLAGTAGTLPEAKRTTALPREVREKVHALVDEGKNLKAALKEVAPAPEREEGAVFVGKVVLEAEQARAFEALLEARGLKRAEAAREALIDWIARHQGAAAEQPELALAR
jgi:ParB-like chromosome segregation protein Spo0J